MQERVEVEKHLAQCDRCLSELASLYNLVKSRGIIPPDVLNLNDAFQRGLEIKNQEKNENPTV